MSEFTNVNIIRAANFYFEGKVSSRTVVFADGSKKTLGVMLPGEYEFGTDAKELMEIQAGTVDILQANESEWKTYTGDTSFYVPANSSFKLKVSEPVDYCCSYL